MYLLSKPKTQFIRQHFFETAARGITLDFACFQQLRSAPELHYLADLHNWDDEVTVLRWVIDNPQCDYGTALLVFWRAQPDYYTQFANEDDAEYERDVFRLLQTIIRNWEAGFYQHRRIKFNPVEEEAVFERPKAKWLIPAAFKQGNGGRVVVAQEAVEKWLASRLHRLLNWRRQLRRKR